MGLPKHMPPQPKHAKRQPQASVLLAFENAILIMEQNGMNEEEIMMMAHLVCVGLIRNGNFTPEYYEIARDVMETKRKEDEQNARLEALRSTISTDIITDSTQ